ncbi:MAG: YceI family protein [Campylobacter sp.]|nr:YceI family protein [Campylobacter sp.]
MKKMLFSVVASSFLLIGSLSAKEYVIDSAHTNISFKIKHMQISNVKGSFSDFEGVLDFDLDTKTINKLEGIVKISSVNTNNEGRDEHLKEADFFEVEKFPEMKFIMTEFIGEDGNEEGIIKGDLTIKDVTKQVSFEYNFGGVVTDEKVDKIGFSLEGKIDRTEFNVGTSGPALGSKVDLELEIEANAI